MTKPPPTQARVRELFNYGPETGWLIHRLARQGATVGAMAGSVTRVPGRFYRSVRVDGESFPASRIIWLHQTGVWPQHQLDHRDRNPLNDRWINLREATPAQKQMNSTRVTYRQGARGVHKHGKKFKAQIMVNQRLIYLGTFETVAEASAVYQAARFKHFGPEFGKLPWSTPRITEAA